MEPLNVTKEMSLVMLNMMMKPSNLWKNKEITKYDKITVIYDVTTTQYNNRTVKYKVLVIWYSKLPTNRYHTQKKGLR